MQLDKETALITSVERTISDLRRGLPVLIEDENSDHFIIVLAAENADNHELGNARLVLTANRMHAIQSDYINQAPVTLAPANQHGHALDDLTGASGKPFIAQPLAFSPADELEQSALQLVKLAQLLPAVLILPHFDALDQLLHVKGSHIAVYKNTISMQLTEACQTPIVLKDAEQAKIVAYRPNIGGQEHYAIVIGQMNDTPLVRVHSSCYTGDLLNSLVCDCRDQLHMAITRMNEEGGGIILYMMQEGRDIGLINKLRAYHFKNQGYDTVDANEILGFDDDERLFLPAAQMLKQLDISQIKLLTNNPKKAKGLEAHNIKVKECVPHIIESNKHNEDYLNTKAKRLGHKF